jgi:hypothetical protein
VLAPAVVRDGHDSEATRDWAGAGHLPPGRDARAPMERLPSGAALRGGGVYEPKWDGTPVRRHRDHSRQPTTTRKKTDRAVGQRARCSRVHDSASLQPQHPRVARPMASHRHRAARRGHLTPSSDRFVFHASSLSLMRVESGTRRSPRAIGGTIGDIGQALFEHVVHDQGSGRVANGTLSDYLIPAPRSRNATENASGSVREGRFG